MSSHSVPSVSISGDGLSIGMIVSEGMKSYPQSRWLDRSSTVRRAVSQEQAAMFAMDALSQQRIARATRNLNGPDNAEVQIIVKWAGQRETIEVAAGSEVKKFSINLQSTDPNHLSNTIRDIVRAIGLVASSGTHLKGNS